MVSIIFTIRSLDIAFESIQFLNGSIDFTVSGEDRFVLNRALISIQFNSIQFKQVYFPKIIRQAIQNKSMKVTLRSLSRLRSAGVDYSFLYVMRQARSCWPY